MRHGRCQFAEAERADESHHSGGQPNDEQETGALHLMRNVGEVLLKDPDIDGFGSQTGSTGSANSANTGKIAYKRPGAIRIKHRQ